ncbi:MAG: hypothetical protein OER43_00535 [Gammaproteobacteria bacterium]|nr:hypothetical protein [Gammaproteobacteria bacterium]MDH3411844.1 hypothetical protein [Gammaproteobacteria bacterium]
MNETTQPSKEDYLTRIGVEMNKHLVTDRWTLRQKLALTCRILAREGLASWLAG